MTNPIPDWFCGAIDVHVHTAPSLFPRLFDDIALARHAAQAGMGGVVLKAHEGETAARAALTAAQVLGIEVYGGIVLNHFVGGFNGYAVEMALALGARVVWMPTMHAANHLGFYGEAGYREQAAQRRLSDAKPLTVLEGDGQLKREVAEILEIITAQGNVILSNGHLNAAETLALFREAKRLGLERLVVAHPTLHLTNFDLAVQLELADLGAVIEHCYLPHLPAWGGVPIEKTAHFIRQVGVERCLLSTDLGQVDSPRPADGLKTFAAALMNQGLSEASIRQLIVRNPAALLA